MEKLVRVYSTSEHLIASVLDGWLRGIRQQMIREHPSLKNIGMPHLFLNVLVDTFLPDRESRGVKWVSEREIGVYFAHGHSSVLKTDFSLGIEYLLKKNLRQYLSHYQTPQTVYTDAKHFDVVNGILRQMGYHELRRTESVFVASKRIPTFDLRMVLEV